MVPFCGSASSKKGCPQVLINLQNNDMDFDSLESHPNRLLLKGRCDEIIKKLVYELDWTEEM
jgi:hypothetical protein